nr:MAG TPA: hypothetical protein [Caudoviricetes sp.]
MRAGTSAVALKLESNHFKGDRGTFLPRSFRQRNRNTCMPGALSPAKF